MAWASDEFWSRDRNLASRPRRSAASSTSRPFWLASVRDVALNAPHSIRSSTVAASPATMNTSRRVASMSSTIEVASS